MQVPQPNITWRREDGRPIFREAGGGAGAENAAGGRGGPRRDLSVHQGEYLDLQDISREQMGAYLCIASNKIPPSVSKRITLVVECKFLADKTLGKTKWTLSAYLVAHSVTQYMSLCVCVCVCVCHTVSNQQFCLAKCFH